MPRMTEKDVPRARPQPGEEAQDHAAPRRQRGIQSIEVGMRVLQALTERGGGALLSIAHRPSVAAFHPRSWKLVPQAAGDGARFGLEAGAV